MEEEFTVTAKDVFDLDDSIVRRKRMRLGRMSGLSSFNVLDFDCSSLSLNFLGFLVFRFVKLAWRIVIFPSLSRKIV